MSDIQSRLAAALAKAVPIAVVAVLLLTACTSDPRPAAAEHGEPAATSPDTGVGTAAGAPALLTLAPGTFGFADASGTRLLALETIANPAAIRATICAGVPARPVVADGRQLPGTHDSGRQTAANFSEQAGERFRVSGAPVPTDVSCYLTADSALVAGLLPFTSPPTPTATTRHPAPPAGGCDSTLTASVAAARARAVAQCWPLGAVPGGPTLFVVRFATRDTNALASVVAVDGAARWYHDVHAVDHGNGESVWRVDDGGVFPADGMRIRFVSRVRGTLLVGMTWDGSEGENAYVFAADSSGAFRTLTHTYRYTAPM